MSVIQRIQEKQKWVFGTIAAALFIFVIQDAFFKSGNSSRSTTIGNVNGESIEYTDFQQEENLIKQINSQQQIDPDQLNEYVWSQAVNRALNKQEVDKLGLVYTGKEFGDAVASNNPPENIRNQFGDRQTGAYNPEMAKNYLSQVTALIKKTPNAAQAQLAYYSIIKTTEEQELAKKYQGLITGAVYVPKWMAQKNNADNSLIANISFVNVPYQTLADSLVKVSDDDVADYIQKHKKEFEQKEETRQIAYVPFDASPSPTDSSKVLDELLGLKQEFATTPAADINAFLQSKESTVSYFDHYLVKSAIKQPNKDTLFKMQPGQVLGPYLDAGSYAMARLISEKQSADSAKVRHILVATAQQDPNTGQMQKIMEDSVANKKLDSAIAEIKAGKSWDSVCLKYSDDPGSKTKGGVFGYFATTDQVDQTFKDSSFGGNKGDKKRIHSIFGFHYIEILDQKGSEPAYKFAYFSKPILESQATDDSVREEASKFSSSVTGSNSLKLFYDNAAKIKKQPMVVPGILENSYSIGNPGYPGSLGKGRPFIKWVYQASVGAISDQPYKFGDKYIVAILTGINKPGLMSVETARPIVEQRIRNEKKAKTIIETKIKGATLEAIAQSSGQQVQQADSLYFQSRGRFGSVVTSEPAVTGAAFNKQLQAKVSQPIAGSSGVFVIKGNSIAGVASTETNLDAQRKTLEYSIKTEVMRQQQPRQGGVSPLQKAAEIKDYRSKFF